MPRGLIDHESFLKLEPAAQENLLRQALLLWLTALDHAGRDPDAWEAEAFTAAIELLAMQAPRTAYRDIERMLLSPSERPSSERPSSERPSSDRPSSERPAPQATRILRVDMSEGAPAPPPPTRETPDRRMLRRRLLQLSTIQPAFDPAEARPSATTHMRRNAEPRSEGDEAD